MCTSILCRECGTSAQVDTQVFPRSTVEIITCHNPACPICGVTLVLDSDYATRDLTAHKAMVAKRGGYQAGA